MNPDTELIGKNSRMDDAGIEPATSSMQTMRSTTELIAPI